MWQRVREASHCGSHEEVNKNINNNNGTIPTRIIDQEARWRWGPFGGSSRMSIEVTVHDTNAEARFELVKPTEAATSSRRCGGGGGGGGVDEATFSTSSSSSFFSSSSCLANALLNGCGSDAAKASDAAACHEDRKGPTAGGFTAAGHENTPGMVLEDYRGVMGVMRVDGGSGSSTQSGDSFSIQAEEEGAESGDVVVYMRGEAKVANVLGARGMVARAVKGALRGQVTRTLGDVAAAAEDAAMRRTRSD